MTQSTHESTHESTTRPRLWRLPVDQDRFALAKLALQTEQWRDAEEGARLLLEEALQSASSDEDITGTTNLSGDVLHEALVKDDRPTLLNVCRLLADIYYMTGRYDVCLTFCAQAVATGTLPQEDYFTDLIRGWIMRRRHQVTAAYELSVERLSHSAQPLPAEARASFLHMRALCELNMGRARQAWRHLQDAVSLCRVEGEMETQAIALNSLAIVEKLFCGLPLAVTHLEEALCLNARLGKTERRAQNILNLAVVKLKSGLAREALALLEEAPEIRRLRRNPNRRLMIRIARAKALLEMGRGQEARRIARPALGEGIKYRIPRVETLALEVLGDCALAEGRISQARRYYERALSMCAHTVAGYMAAGADLEAGLQRRLGQAALLDRQPSQAAIALRKAVQAARGSHERFEEGVAQRFLSVAYRQASQYRRAWEASRRAVAVLRDYGAALELARALVETAEVQFAWWRAEGSDCAGIPVVSDGPGEPRGRLERVWAYTVEALHCFDDLAHENGRRACLQLMERLRAEAAAPWREQLQVRVADRGSCRLGKPVEFVARAPTTRRLLELAEVAASGAEPVLVTGETGTGKELIARLIHESSGRREEPWVPVNCAAIPESLFEREFFGHREGAFTGAGRGRSGLCDKADGGTLFLDEIGEIPWRLQAKLLRLLQEGTFRRLGEPDESRVDVRVVAATNADLKELIATGRFRQDLYYRLQAFELWLPPLRDRVGDIDALIALFVRQAAAAGTKPEDVFDAEVLMALRCYPWPGNVRELAALTKRLALTAVRTGRVTVSMLPKEIAQCLPQSYMEGRGQDLVGFLKQAERERIIEIMTRVQGNRTEAARRLGISRNTLYKKMEKLGIRIPF